MIADVLSLYGEEVAAFRRSKRNIGYNITNLLKWWADKKATHVNKKTCQAYAATKAEQGAAADLKVLKAALKHWHESDFGPLETIPVVWRPDPNPPKDRWLTREEAAKLVRAAKPYRHLRRMILLGLYTGSRPGVLLALQWSQVDLRGGLLHRTPKGEKQDKRKRAPAVKLGRRILGHLRRWRALDGDAQYVCQFTDRWHPGSRVVKDPHGTWHKVIEAAGLQGVTRHTLRHTRATWMAQAGVSMFEAAGFLGMTVRTLERTYAHHDPRHQEHAANI